MRAAKTALDRTLAAVCVILFALLVVTVVWQVFSRQVINNPSTWSEEAARYIFVWLGFFAAALVFSERGHIAVDFVVKKFSVLAQRIVAVLVQVLIMAFALIGLVWGGWRASQGAWDTNLTALPTQVGVMYLVMPVTGILITIYTVFHLLGAVRGAEAPEEITHNPEAI